MTPEQTKRLEQLRDLESGKHLDRAELAELDSLELLAEQERVIAYMDSLPLVQALWWFIENGIDDSPSGTAVFFHTRERVKTEAS